MKWIRVVTTSGFRPRNACLNVGWREPGIASARKSDILPFTDRHCLALNI